MRPPHSDCSGQANLYSEPSDSGSPVFTWGSSWYGVFYAGGIVYAGYLTQGDTVVAQTLFSTWSQLEDHFGMPLHPEPPVVPMEVMIHGPHIVSEEDTCTWTTQITGDWDSPLQYTWFLNFNQTQETSSSFEHYIEPQTPYFTVSVHVIDQLGQIAADTLEVDVGGSPPPPPCA